MAKTKDTIHECKDISENVYGYMKIVGITSLKSLLVSIGAELKKKNLEDFYEKEKANFTNMLKGKRPLKFEFIKPLEKLFGVTFARLYDNESYLVPRNKDDIPYIKGFRYYAYKDDMDLYQNDFEQTMISCDGFPTILNYDEFNKTFLDYVVEYGSINAVRYLVKEHDLKPELYAPFNKFRIDRQYEIMCAEPFALLKMVIQKDDVELFNRVFDPFIVFIQYSSNFKDTYFDEDILDLILNSEHVFNCLFEPRTLPYKNYNPAVVGRDEEMIDLLNPFLNKCLSHALDKLNKYYEQAKRILEFGVTYNKAAIEKTGVSIDKLRIDETGLVYYRGTHELLGSIVYHEKEIADVELRNLSCGIISPERRK